MMMSGTLCFITFPSVEFPVTRDIQVMSITDQWSFLLLGISIGILSMLTTFSNPSRLRGTRNIRFGILNVVQLDFPNDHLMFYDANDQAEYVLPCSFFNTKPRVTFTSGISKCPYLLEEETFEKMRRSSHTHQPKNETDFIDLSWLHCS